MLVGDDIRGNRCNGCPMPAPTRRTASVHHITANIYAHSQTPHNTRTMDQQTPEKSIPTPTSHTIRNIIYQQIPEKSIVDTARSWNAGGARPVPIAVSNAPTPLMLLPAILPAALAPSPGFGRSCCCDCPRAPIPIPIPCGWSWGSLPNNAFRPNMFQSKMTGRSEGAADGEDGDDGALTTWPPWALATIFLFG